MSIAVNASAQQVSNLRVKRVALNSDTLSLDTLSIVPGTMQVMVKGRLLSAGQFHLLASQAKLVLDSAVQADSIMLTYRVFPIKFDQKYFHKDPDRIEPDATGKANPFTYKATSGEEDIFGLTGLEKRGSISRGVNFGNSQDLSVNSNLDLQLAGKLNERVSILAAISDQNIPIQPEGNTQYLQEFDQVYIQLYDDKSKLIAGDFQLQAPDNHFLTV